MWLALIVTSFHVFTGIYGRILLYNTENNPESEKFDCIYYTRNTEQVIPYCRRPGESKQLFREKGKCQNYGEEKLFRDLLQQEIRPREILQWSSSVEIADAYASVFYNRSLIGLDDNRFVCNCSQSGTFGKYCEYQLTHETTSFSDSVQAQFQQKAEDAWNTQRYGKILCYETLYCSSSDLCLDWRDIGDGTQQCPGGTDEENWDTLEFNECEGDEFRCTNGMCIPREFWLDGKVLYILQDSLIPLIALTGHCDCMDWSDELDCLRSQKSCPVAPYAMECDERICSRGAYSCGDGQCIAWETRLGLEPILIEGNDCFNKRNLNYMCEISRDRPAWTLDSGLCWPDEGFHDSRYSSWNMTHSTKLSNDEKCLYLFQCVLTDAFERNCPCNYRNCTTKLASVCSLSDYLIIYPPLGLINPYYRFYYNYSRIMKNPIPVLWAMGGYVRCRGYLLQTQVDLTARFIFGWLPSYHSYHILCTAAESNRGYQDFSSDLQYDANCWNESLAFNGRPYAVNPDMCAEIGQCISQYRINDGYEDCFFKLDENVLLERSHCTGNPGRHRFQCYNDEQKCLPLSKLNSIFSDCSNHYDETYYGIGQPLHRTEQCWANNKKDCNFWKEYIEQSSRTNLSASSSLDDFQQQSLTHQVPFRMYCDSFWNSRTYSDESASSCRHWICKRGQYKCRTGQCIPLDWVCDGEWDCSDASDEEASVLIQHGSPHSARLELCQKRYSQSPFSDKCNTSFEFGCYLANVSHPLDIELNHPCINLTQIGDGIENCYKSYDEKNRALNLETKDMLGFGLTCGNQTLPYYLACQEYIRNNCSEVLCSRRRDVNGSCSGERDFICLEDNSCVKDGRCDGDFDCSHGEDEYWCLLDPDDLSAYRSGKRQVAEQWAGAIAIPYYPLQAVLEPAQQPKAMPIINSSFVTHSYRCNRGVSVLYMNETQCLCPPAYYGRWCEFYSDRISVIVRVDQETTLKLMPNTTLKIKANFLFTDTMIDYHEFHVVPALELIKNSKYTFYLIYPRSEHMLEHKRYRYFDRYDIIHHHPYSVHFDIFSLESNTSNARELGSWHYPVYFDYLPAFRLAVILRFPLWFAKHTQNPCSQNNCSANGACMPIFNLNNSYYCSCNSGYYGDNCDLYETHCEIYCSANALCRPDSGRQETSGTNRHCICPLNHFGPRCNLNDDSCDSNPCLNKGTCFLSYDLSGEVPYVCVCSNRFFGERCQHENALVRVNINLTSALSIRATVVQLCDLVLRQTELFVQNQQVFRGLPSAIRYNMADKLAPDVGLLKIYDDAVNAHYFIMYLLQQSVINITSSPKSCPHVSLVLPKTVFIYHGLCQNDAQLFCFYDKSYLCICNQDHDGVECFLHNSQFDHCDHCLSRGKCLQGDRKDPDDFLCLCPSCHQGHRCEFSMQAFGFTLDSLLNAYSAHVKVAYAIFVVFFFIIGLFNNFCSFVTFKRPAPRKFGVGNYLFIVTCLSQASLLCLICKFIQITFGIANLVSCKVISYLLSVLTRSTYWLLSWVTVDRLLIILCPTSMKLKNPYLAIKISTLTLAILIGMHVHEAIYYTAIRDTSADSTICVINFNNQLITDYNRVSTLIHYLIPFVVQFACINLTIVLVARNRAKTAGQKVTFRQVLKTQFQAQKELYVTPIIIVLSALPQTILTFNLACTELAIWQRHALLVAYLLSYAPQVLGFLLYVLPSTNYKKEFSDTLFAKKHLKWMLHKNKNVNKTKNLTMKTVTTTNVL